VIPESLSDEDLLLLADIASTGFSAAENGRIRLGDTIAVFAQGPIGLCATLGAKLKGASQIFAVDADAGRLRVSEHFGAMCTLLAAEDPVGAIRAQTSGRSVDVAIEALGIGMPSVLSNRVESSRASVYIPAVSESLSTLFGAGLADQTTVTALCPGRKNECAASSDLSKPVESI
jgi:threonine dehydrogenase-like Zn-dependent dehydrogenase